MKEPTILLIDCNPTENLGDNLETLLGTTELGAKLRREVIVDAAQIQSCDWTTGRDLLASLVFLILPRSKSEAEKKLLQLIKRQQPQTPIIVVVAHECGPDQTLDLLQHGASDFIAAPLTVTDTLPRVWRLLERSESHNRAAYELKEAVGLKQLIGQKENFLAEVRKIPLIAKCDSRALICGETGTGKEMCARAIHYLSPRTRQPFVPVNCGAMPVELIENELFGHEKGAFTGAHSSKAGLIEEAEQGTLFLDEIDCLPLMAQVKLLRFLQEKEYRRLGSSKVRHADVRVIAASNAPLLEAVRAGRVRQDLYYRLNVVSITLPPLRERREDILPLARHFLAKYATAVHDRAMSLTPEAIQKLTFYDWPGNVRELEHTIERAVMFCEGSCLEEADIVLPSVPAPRLMVESFKQAKAKIVEQFEKDYIQRLLLSYRGNISKAAQAARKNRRAFWQLIRKHQINVHGFKLGSS